MDIQIDEATVQQGGVAPGLRSGARLGFEHQLPFPHPRLRKQVRKVESFLFESCPVKAAVSGVAGFGLGALFGVALAGFGAGQGLAPAPMTIQQAQVRADFLCDVFVSVMCL